MLNSSALRVGISSSVRVVHPFSKSKESVSDNPRSGRRVTFLCDENIEKVRKLITRDRHLTVRMIADELQINHEYDIPSE
ncbi:hypothetical protein TNCV_2771061 [Trichonephila clavipes]|nr:hypothetical protein TNCV_2771061 [Trichonephila clavipes]